jgi:hypothetical protein
MVRPAIRNTGQKAESLFLELVGTARPSDAPRRGDAIVEVDGHDHYVELKECHASPGKGGTINQVRAIKYITCVIWAPKYAKWFVLSPDQLVSLASTKNRGQHTEIPFESMTIRLANLGDQFHETADDRELEDVVTRAIQRGEAASAAMKELMPQLLDEIDQLKRKYLQLAANAH